MPQTTRSGTGGRKHFSEGQHGYANVEMVIIDQVREGDYEGLKQKEAFWQHQMMCFLVQGGLNCADDLDDSDPPPVTVAILCQTLGGGVGLTPNW